jgi:hypothetical protein
MGIVGIVIHGGGRDRRLETDREMDGVQDRAARTGGWLTENYDCERRQYPSGIYRNEVKCSCSGNRDLETRSGSRGSRQVM